MKWISFWSVYILIFNPALASETEVLTLKAALERGYSQNPSYLASVKRVSSEKALKYSKTALDKPMVGIQKLDRNMETSYFSVGQKIKFPLKYYYEYDSQSKKAEAFKANSDSKKWELRAEIIQLYYKLFAIRKIVGLTQASIESLTDFARIAETKYSAGKAPQQDSMKAHLEMTKLQSKLVELKEQERNTEIKLREKINSPGFEKISLPNAELIVPDGNNVSIKTNEFNPEASPEVISSKQLLLSTEAKETLSWLNYAPDFQVKYLQRYGGMPNKSHIVMAEMSIPLWFWGETSKGISADYKTEQAKHEFEANKLRNKTQFETLREKVKSGYELITIFKTSLMPQARTAYNSSLSAYRANKINFLELLDSERSEFNIKVQYYRSLITYISNWVQLEQTMGQRLFNFEEGKAQ